MRTMRWMPWALAGLGSLALAAPTRADQAQDAARTAKFREMDKDGNGSLDLGEYGGHRGNFKALDKNKDGALNVEEFVHRQDVRPEEPAPAPEKLMVPGGVDPFVARDLDRNGIVDRNEWTDHREFTRRDADRDDQLTREEFFLGEVKDPRLERFDRMDRNRDGVINRGEWKGGSSTWERIDVNRDGVITRSEYLQ